MQTNTFPRSLALGSALLLFSFSCLAEDRVVRQYSFDVSDIREIRIQASVGSIDIEPTDDEELKLVLEIKGDDHGWFRRDKDVADVELESRVRGDRLILEQTEKDTNTQWTIHMPRVQRTELHLGVGSIDAELGATELEIELGVGDVDIDYPKAEAGYIELSVGVGDATLRGTRDVRTNKAFISHDVQGHGEGDNDIDIHVGVGDVNFRLQ